MKVFGWSVSTDRTEPRQRRGVQRNSMEDPRMEDSGCCSRIRNRSDSQRSRISWPATRFRSPCRSGVATHIFCGDSNLVIRQMRGEIDCKAPGLQLIRHKAKEKHRLWPIHEFLHMKRDWNPSPDRLASKVLQQEQASISLSNQNRQD